jgi:hypothetical protein
MNENRYSLAYNYLNKVNRTEATYFFKETYIINNVRLIGCSLSQKNRKKFLKCIIFNIAASSGFLSGKWAWTAVNNFSAPVLNYAMAPLYDTSADI